MVVRASTVLVLLLCSLTQRLSYLWLSTNSMFCPIRLIGSLHLGRWWLWWCTNCDFLIFAFMPDLRHQSPKMSMWYCASSIFPESTTILSAYIGMDRLVSPTGRPHAASLSFWAKSLMKTANRVGERESPYLPGMYAYNCPGAKIILIIGSSWHMVWCHAKLHKEIDQCLWNISAKNKRIIRLPLPHYYIQ